jgi:hypothetical protein
MSPEELARLVDAYRDGTIGREDAGRLVAVIRAGGEESRRVLRELEFEGILAQALAEPDDEAFLRSLNERIAAEREESAFLRAFEGRRALVSVKKRPPRGWGLPAALAGAVLLAGLLYFVMTSGPGVPPQKIAEQHARPEPGEAPPAPLEVLPSPSEGVPTPEPPGREVAPPVPAPPPVSEPPPPPSRPPPPKGVDLPRDENPAPPPAPPKETRVALATVTSVQGEVFRLDGASRAAIVEGQGLATGQGIECGAKGSVTALFPDGTRLELGSDTVVREMSDRKGKRVMLARGVLVAQVAKQPADAPMVFATPHGEARVLGTALRLEVDAQTRLEVTEGRVRLTRTGGKAADVPSGNVALCGPGLDPVARVAHPEEIVLLPRDARLVGDEWRVTADRNASSGAALEVAKAPFKPIDHVDKRPSFALFTFWASSEFEYRLWLRSSSLATGDRWTREMVTLEPQNCTLSAKSPFFGAMPTTAFVFTGLASWTGYGWSSGPFDEAKPDAAPLLVKFKTTGMQTLRVFTDHPSIRIDGVWLSVRQSVRPAAKFLPPPEGR